MVTIRAEISSDVGPREALLNRAFGVKRFRKTSEKMRKDRLPAEGLAFSAVDENGKLVGTIRLWNIFAGSAGEALLLGPLAVDGKARGHGIGAALMNHALSTAQDLGHAAIVLVGDPAYYDRFGFSGQGTRSLHLPGPVDRARFLGLELVQGALDGAEGLIAACGRPDEGFKVAA